MRGSRVKFSELVGARAALAGGMSTVYTDLFHCLREIRETGPMIQRMQHLWAPWRMEFIKAPKPSGCFFCEAASADPSDDPVHLVLARGALAPGSLNRYPYNNGHLMSAPKAHLANLEDLPAATANELTALTQRSLRGLRQVLAPQGFNLRVNAGKDQGAGVGAPLT